MPDEVQGFMRLAQSDVKVNVVGTDKVGTFKTKECASFILVHEQDMAQFIKNTIQLQELLKGKPKGKEE